MPEITGNPEFERVIQEVLEMHRRKGADYGTDEDFFANVSASGNWGIAPWVGAMMRANDKVVRLQAAAKGSTLKNEGIEDSLIDIATYAIIAVCLFRRQTASANRDSADHLEQALITNSQKLKRYASEAAFGMNNAKRRDPKRNKNINTQKFNPTED
jgi:hypothetical protein